MAPIGENAPAIVELYAPLARSSLAQPLIFLSLEHPCVYGITVCGAPNRLPSRGQEQTPARAHNTHAHRERKGGGEEKVKDDR